MRAIRPPVPLHPDVAANLQMNGFVGCVQNVHGWRQNSLVSTVLSMEAQQRRNHLSEGVDPLAHLSISADMLLAGARPLIAASDDAAAVSEADCDSPNEAVRGVEKLISELADDDG